MITLPLSQNDWAKVKDLFNGEDARKNILDDILWVLTRDTGWAGIPKTLSGEEELHPYFVEWVDTDILKNVFTRLGLKWEDAKIISYRNKVILPQDFIDMSSGGIEKARITNIHADLPSVFIGSATESHIIAKQVQQLFDSNKFQVDTWKMNVFGQRDEDGNLLSNAEQLKNFTDIYDFAIFIFSPDDRLISRTRKWWSEERGDKLEMIEANATRHNVVFEFGLFLGRIGADRSFILYDAEIENFVKYFFTDLTDNLEDGDNQHLLKDDFQLESYRYEANYTKYLDSQGKERKEIENIQSLKDKVDIIINRMKETKEKVSIGFLPSTSLAFGYYNNFVGRVIQGLYYLLDRTDAEISDSEILRGLKRKQHIYFKIVKPLSLKATQYHQLIKNIKEFYIDEIAIPTPGARRMTVYYDKKGIDEHVNEFSFYDIPTTMNSSIEAIDLTTTHTDIKELLSEKEKKNFEKVMEYLLERISNKSVTPQITVTMIDWETFLNEVKNEK